MLLFYIGLIIAMLVVITLIHFKLHKWTINRINTDTSQRINNNAEVWSMHKKHKKGNLKLTISDKKFKEIVINVFG